MMLRRLPALFVLIIALIPALTGAQTPPADPLDCPKARVCVSYADVVIEIDPNDGSLVGFVVTVSETTTETLSGTTTTHSGEAVWFLRSGETYIVVAEGVPISDAQAAKPAEPGDLILPKLAD